MFSYRTYTLIFVDTPGIHKPHHKLGEVLVKNARIAIESVDVLLFVVDGSVEAGGGDRFIVDLLTDTQMPIILGLNKIDQQPPNFPPLDDTYAELAASHNWQMVKFSALSGEGLESLQQVLIDRHDISLILAPHG